MPRNTDAAQHARRAEELVGLARSTSMQGWLRRGRRREILAAANVHALLAVAGAATNKE